MPEGWKGGPPPWKSGAGWGPPTGHQAWGGFGRKMFLGFLVLFLLVPLMVAMAGALFVIRLLGAGPIAGLAVAAIPVGIALTVFLVGRYGSRTWRSVRELIRAAGALADGDYSARVTTDGSASMRPVIDSFNQMARRLESADTQRRRLLADLGHELRTPLTIVRGEIEAMLDGVHRADPEHLELLLDEVAVMERLIEDLRTMSLAEAGALALHPEPTDVADLVTDIAESHRRTAAEQGVVIAADADPAIGEVVLDPVRIREVLTNLVVNSLRAMPDGGALRLSARIDGAELVLEVGDTGTGIPPEEVELMFDRFRKGSDSPGTGLGLTISKDLVEIHGGTIELDSDLGAGTVARVRLPLVRPSTSDRVRRF